MSGFFEFISMYNRCITVFLVSAPGFGWFRSNCGFRCGTFRTRPALYVPCTMKIDVCVGGYHAKPRRIAWDTICLVENEKKKNEEKIYDISIEAKQYPTNGTVKCRYKFKHAHAKQNRKQLNCSHSVCFIFFFFLFPGESVTHWLSWLIGIENYHYQPNLWYSPNGFVLLSVSVNTLSSGVRRRCTI